LELSHGLLVASLRGSVEIDRDLSWKRDLTQKRVGPLALARLYGESRIFTVNFVWYGLDRNDEGNSFEESIFCQIFGRKYLSPNLWKEGSFANLNQQCFACMEISFIVEIALL
jgi:hypothetical protein